MTDEQAGLIGREFRHFKMHLRRDAPAAKRSGWVSEANCEAAARPRAVRFPDEQREELCKAKRVRGMTRNMIYHNDNGWRLEK